MVAPGNPGGEEGVPGGHKGGDGVGWEMGSHEAGQGGSPHGKGLPVLRCSMPGQGRANTTASSAGLGHPGTTLTPKTPPITRSMSLPVACPLAHGMSLSPWRDGADMGGVLHALPHLDHKDVSRST